MTQPTWHIAGTLALAATLLTPAVFAQSRADQREEAMGGDEWSDGNTEGSLELDEEQLMRLREMRAEMNYDLEPIHEEIQELKQELAQAWSAEYPDLETIQSLNEWLIFMDTLIRERRNEFRFEMLEILDDWQREVLAETKFGGDERRRRNQDGAVPRYGRLERQLDLDEFQQDIVYDLFEDFQDATSPARVLLEELEEELDLLWAAEQPDEDSIYEVGEDMDALRLGINELEVTFFAFLHELLYDDQRELLSQMMNREGRRGSRAVDETES